MPDDNTTDTTTTDTASTDRTDSTTTDTSSNSDYPDGLGDAGKRAIDRMKSERDEARRLLREAQNASQSQQSTTTDTSDRNGRKDDDKGKSAEQVEKELIERLTQGALRSAVREIAGSKLADPEDALVLGNWSDMTPNEFGEFDRSAITSKIDDLIKSKSYLAKSDKKFEGSADSGNRGDSQVQGQVTRESLKSMTPAEINKARADGRLQDVLSGKK